MVRKAISLAMLFTVLATNIAVLQPACAQEYKILPPIADQSIKDISNITPLKGQVATVPANSAFMITTNSSISSSSNQVGEIIIATVDNPISLNGNVIIPQGSEVIGQITYIENSGRIGKNAAMDVKFTTLKLTNGQKLPMSAKIITFDKSGTLKGGSLKKQIVTSVATGAVSTAGGTLAGLTVGSLMGAPGGGAVFGLTAGGIFSLGYIFARKGKEVNLPSGTKLNLQLEQPIILGGAIY